MRSFDCCVGKSIRKREQNDSDASRVRLLRGNGEKSVQLTIRARLTVLYFVVLAASFFAFFWICDFGFQRSIETTVNDASCGNLNSVRKVIETSLPQGIPQAQNRWPPAAGQPVTFFHENCTCRKWLFRSPHFLSPQSSLPAIPSTGVSFLTTNLELRQYRIARERVLIDGNTFLIDAAVPTEPSIRHSTSSGSLKKSFCRCW